MGLNIIILRYFVLFVFVFLGMSACNTKTSKSDIAVIFTPDTLDVGYTYWWTQSGPFIGDCGDEISLVFSGIVRALQKPTDDPGPLYTSQEGIIEIDKIFKIKALRENSYANQKFFSTDCFFGQGLKVGDTVLIFCYDYEGAYSIPGGKSVLKISSYEDPLIGSLKKYFDSEEDPIKLKSDLDLWATHGLDRALEGVISCREAAENL